MTIMMKTPEVAPAIVAVRRESELGDEEATREVGNREVIYYKMRKDMAYFRLRLTVVEVPPIFVTMVVKLSDVVEGVSELLKLVLEVT